MMLRSRPAFATGTRFGNDSPDSPVRRKVESGVERQPRWVRAVRVHDIDFQVAISPTRECDFQPVRRPRGILVVTGIATEGRLARAVRIHHEYLDAAVPQALERNPASIG